MLPLVVGLSSLLILVALLTGWKMNLLQKAGFWCGYKLYVRSPGYYLHQRLLRREQMDHSQPLRHRVNDRIEILAVPMLSDNYGYAIIDTQQKSAVLVDPCDPHVMQAALDERQITQILGILTTHYHWDHAGGNKILSETRPSHATALPVYGSEHFPASSLSAMNQPLKDGANFRLGDFVFQALYTPGHTTTDMVFVFFHRAARGNESIDAVQAQTTSWSLFTGDVLFSGGCGKFFECEASTMYHSLQRIRNLHLNGPFAGSGDRGGQTKAQCDQNTLIWGGHEYTVPNLQFVYNEVDQRGTVVEALEWAQSQRSSLQPTMPSTLARELSFNPFLKPEDHACGASSTQDEEGLAPEEVSISRLARLRQMKDSFSS